ncbi:MAG: hypothetical protein DLM62_11580 [Pseudonocardiales bacterium]|nr:MAG: hypothetical protein DLM62_11580 [Pseudonocardiales bacterium]
MRRPASPGPGWPGGRGSTRPACAPWRTAPPPTAPTRTAPPPTAPQPTAPQPTAYPLPLRPATAAAAAGPGVRAETARPSRREVTVTR